MCSAEDGDEIVKIALDRFGAVHVLIANAGILRDKSFTAMSEKEWDQVIAVHLRYDPLFPVEPSAETCAGVLIRQDLFTNPSTVAHAHSVCSVLRLYGPFFRSRSMVAS